MLKHFFSSVAFTEFFSSMQLKKVSQNQFCAFFESRNIGCNAMYKLFLIELFLTELKEIVRRVAKKLKVYTIFFVNSTDFFFCQLAVKMFNDFFAGHNAGPFDI